MSRVPPKASSTPARPPRQRRTQPNDDDNEEANEEIASEKEELSEAESGSSEELYETFMNAAAHGTVSRSSSVAPSPTRSLSTSLVPSDTPHLPTISRSPADDNMPEEQVHEGAEIASLSSCKLPPFWRQQPTLWFIQIESIFHTNQIGADALKYHLAVAALDPSTVTEVSDLLRSPPDHSKYETLKSQVLERLTDSADKRLEKMLNEQELGDRKPSQLLREMRALAGDRASEDVLRIKWLALLPLHVQNVLKIFTSNALVDLVVAADKLMESPIGFPPCSSSGSSFSRSPSPGVYAVQSPPANDDIKHLLAQLISVSREILSKVSSPTYNQQPSQQQHSRSRSQSSSTTSRGRSASPRRPSTGGSCWYHHRFGASAHKCLQPCNYNPGLTHSQGNA